MIPLLAPSAPERDAPATVSRKRGDEAVGSTFDGEIEGAARRANGAAREGVRSMDEDESPEVAKDDDAAGQAAEPEERAPTGRGLMDVLAALTGAATDAATKAGPANGGRAEAPALAQQDGAAPYPAGATLPDEPREIDVANVLLRNMPSAEGETDAGATAKVRMKIARQETHFEPTRQEAVMVDAAPQDAASAGRPKVGSEGLLQFLAARPFARAAADAGAASAPARSAKPGVDGADMPDGEAEADAAKVSERSAAVERPAGTARSADLPEMRGGREPVRDRSAVVFPSSGSERQAVRESDAGRSVQAPSLPGSSAATPPAPIAAQLAGRVVDAFFGPEAARRPEAPSLEAHLRLRAGGAVLKTLTIELQPEHLGTLSVSMRLKDGELAIEMSASRAETARVLSEDRAMLKSLLEKAGFSLDEAAITVSTRDVTASQTSQGAGRDASSDGAGRGISGNGSDASGGREREGRGGNGSSGREGPTERPAPRGEAPQPRSGSVFL